MKKFILLIALSALFCSAPGNAGGAEGKEALAPAEALARLQASVKEFEKQETTSCKRLVTALQAWKKKTEEAYVEADAAESFVNARMPTNPLAYLSVEHSDISDPLPYMFELEGEIAYRACDIKVIIYGRAAAAQAAAARAQAYLVRLSATSAEEAAAPVADNDASYLVELAEASEKAAAARRTEADDLKIQGLIARCFEIQSEVGRGGSIPPGVQQEIRDISRRTLREQKETLTQMERVYCQFLEDEINHQVGVMALVDEGHVKVQQSFEDVQECYEPFFKQRATEFDAGALDEAHPTEGLAEDLWTRAEEYTRAEGLFSLSNKNTEEMRERCSQTIALVRGNLDARHTSLEEVEAKATEKATLAKGGQLRARLEQLEAQLKKEQGVLSFLNLNPATLMKMIQLSADQNSLDAGGSLCLRPGVADRRSAADAQSRRVQAEVGKVTEEWHKVKAQVEAAHERGKDTHATEREQLRARLKQLEDQLKNLTEQEEEAHEEHRVAYAEDDAYDWYPKTEERDAAHKKCESLHAQAEAVRQQLTDTDAQYKQVHAQVEAAKKKHKGFEEWKQEGCEASKQAHAERQKARHQEKEARKEEAARLAAEAQADQGVQEPEAAAPAKAPAPPADPA